MQYACPRNIEQMHSYMLICPPSVLFVKCSRLHFLILFSYICNHVDIRSLKNSFIESMKFYFFKKTIYMKLANLVHMVFAL